MQRIPLANVGRGSGGRNGSRIKRSFLINAEESLISERKTIGRDFPHDFADSTGFDMHISQATIEPLFSLPFFFFFLIRGYSEKHSRGIEFEEYTE